MAASGIAERLRLRWSPSFLLAFHRLQILRKTVGYMIIYTTDCTRYNDPSIQQLSTSIDIIRSLHDLSCSVHRDLLVELEQISNIVSTSEEDGASLMNMFGYKVENAALACCRNPTRLLKDAQFHILTNGFPVINPLTCSVRYAIGKASYSNRSFPLLLFLSSGYPKIPPYSSVRCTSATMEPI